MEVGRLKKHLCVLFFLFIPISIIAVNISGYIDKTNCIWGPIGSNAQIEAECIYLTGDVIVPTDMTLAILPGTTIKANYIDEPKLSAKNLYPQLEIAVYGRLEAIGTEEKPICFSGTINNLGHWQGIFCEGALKITYATIEDAISGITSAGAHIDISYSNFRNNQTGISLWGWQTSSIKNCLISENIDGIASASAIASIENNNIQNNNIGIKINFGEVAPKITNNTFKNNTQYHIFNLCITDVLAYPNFWDMPLDNLKDKLFDGRKEPEVGVVIYQ